MSPRAFQSSDEQDESEVDLATVVAHVVVSLSSVDDVAVLDGVNVGVFGVVRSECDVVLQLGLNSDVHVVHAVLGHSALGSHCKEMKLNYKWSTT